MAVFVVVLKILFVLVVVAVVAAGALAPYTLLRARDVSERIALAVGLATFPGLPLVWHIVGELRRRGRPPGALRPRDRLIVRTLVVTAASVGASALIAGPAALADRLPSTFGSWVSRWRMPALVRHVPEGATVLLRASSGGSDIQEAVADLRKALPADQRVDKGLRCGVDWQRTEIVAGFAEPDRFVAIVRAPRLGTEAALRCLAEAALEGTGLGLGFRDEAGLRAIDLTRPTHAPDSGKNVDKVSAFLLDGDTVVVVSASWQTAVRERLGGAGRAAVDTNLAGPFANLDRSAHVWAVARAPKAEPRVSELTAGLTFRKDQLRIAARARAPSAAVASELAAEVKRRTGAVGLPASLEARGRGADGGFKLDVAAEGDAVRLDLVCSKEALGAIATGALPWLSLLPR